ncbi:MAG TPA: sensor histidine kinase [Ktedonobacterales bacterium]
MTSPPTSAANAEVPAPTLPTERAPARLHGGWLWAAHAGWLAMAALTVGVFIASVVTRIAALQAACPDASCANVPLPPATRAAFAALGLSYATFIGYFIALDVVVALVFGLVAGLIHWRRPDDRMALLVSLALLTFGAATFTGATDALAIIHPAWRIPVALLNFVGSATFILTLYLLPDGHFVPRWTRWAALIWIAQQAPHYFLSKSALDLDTWPTALGVAIWIAFIGSAVVAQVYRYRRVSGQVAREQARWIGFGVSVALVGFLGGRIALVVLAPKLDSPNALLLAMIGATLVDAFILMIPLSIAVAILRYRLFDIDTLINRTLVYGALSACVVGLYALIVGGASALFQARANLLISLLATGVVAVLFQPLRERVQRWVNRLLYGEREEPYAILSTLGRRLEGALSPDETLPAVVETVAQALKLPYAAISLRDGEEEVIAASYGVRAGEPLPLDLTYQGETIGQLLLCPRAPSEGWSAKERRLLDDLARQAGVAAHAVELHTELRRARERLVIAREEERRRLRRDLHDGLGPQLASQTLTLSAASKLLRADPAAAEALLSEALTHAQTAVTDIRRLVYGLRPPALDDLGLVGALTDQAAQYSASGLRVTVTAPDPFPLLPAAVEVACYRIAQEALTNVARHAQARSAMLTLTVDTPNQALTLEVVDDGCGLPAQLHAGLGLASMRERAAELGGTCVVATAPGGGVRVYARLPLSS